MKRIIVEYLNSSKDFLDEIKEITNNPAIKNFATVIRKNLVLLREELDKIEDVQKPYYELQRPENRELLLAITENMHVHGGSFVSALADAMIIADHINLKKIQDTWPEYIERYHPRNWKKEKNNGA